MLNILLPLTCPRKTSPLSLPFLAAFSTGALLRFDFSFFLSLLPPALGLPILPILSLPAAISRAADYGTDCQYLYEVALHLFGRSIVEEVGVAFVYIEIYMIEELLLK